jgi:MFS transporter, ACS family, tartrate transporter
LFYLTDRPADAHWLEPDEQAWLSQRLDAEHRQRVDAEHFSIGRALSDPRVLALAVVYFGAVSANYGVGFFMPTIVKAFGLTNAQTGWVSALPYVVGTVGMVWYGRRSDTKMERKGHAAVALAIAAIGIAAAAFTEAPVLKMALLCFGAFGVFAVLPIFWTLPTTFLSGTAAAAGIAIINALGNLAGFAGPYAMGFIKDQTGSFMGGLLVIAGLVLISMVVVLALPHDAKLESAPPEGVPAE